MRDEKRAETGESRQFSKTIRAVIKETSPRKAKLFVKSQKVSKELNDNPSVNDRYRFHDAFHLANSTTNPPDTQQIDVDLG